MSCPVSKACKDNRENCSACGSHGNIVMAWLVGLGCNAIYDGGNKRVVGTQYGSEQSSKDGVMFGFTGICFQLYDSTSTAYQYTVISSYLD